MSWQVAVYACSRLVLAGGFAWYERSRPPARMVALVAALAALAVAGRLAFAPIPNVVATTDIVLITGYAVGGGARASRSERWRRVVSNLWLGQGPWTPWQMAGWGLVGVGGAALAVLTRRALGRGRPRGRLRVAGFAYGALLDFSVMVTYGGEQSLDRYLALSARGRPVQRRPRRRQHRPRAGRRAGAGADDLSLPEPVRVRLAAGAGAVAPVRRSRTVAARVLAVARLSLGGLAADAIGAAGSVSGDAAGSSAPRTATAASPPRPAGLERGDHRLGGAGARGGRAQPARRRRAAGTRRSATCARNLGGVRSTGDLERTILALRRGRARPRGASAAGTWWRSFAGAASRDRVVRGPGQPDGLRDPGAARRRAPTRRRSARSAPGCAMRRTATAAGASSRTPAATRTARAPRCRASPRPGAAVGPRAEAPRTCAASSSAGGGFALAGAAPPTRSRPPGRSRVWSPPGPTRPRSEEGRQSPLDYLAHRQAGDGHYRYSSSSDQTPVWVTGQALLAVNRKAFPLAATPRAPTDGRSGPETEARERAG